MLGKKYWYNGLEISPGVNETTIDYSRNWIAGISNIDRKLLNTSDNIMKYKGTHGAFTTPTLAHGRYIRIDGLVRGKTRADLLAGMEYIENLFKLQSYTYETELNVLEFIDEKDRTWQIEAKVRTPVHWDFETDDGKDGTLRKYKVELFAPIPYIYSKEDLTQSVSEGDYAGIKLYTTLGAKFDEPYNPVICQQTAGNFQSYTIWELEILENMENLIIYNVDTNDKFELATTFKAGDKITIDGRNLAVYKNGYRLDGVLTDTSLFPVVYQTSRFIVRDKTSIFYDGRNKITGTVYFKNVIL